MHWSFVKPGSINNVAAGRETSCTWIFLQLGLLTFLHRDPLVETLSICADSASGIDIHVLQVFEQRDSCIIVVHEYMVILSRKRLQQFFYGCVCNRFIGVLVIVLCFANIKHRIAQV